MAAAPARQDHVDAGVGRPRALVAVVVPVARPLVDGDRRQRVGAPASKANSAEKTHFRYVVVFVKKKTGERVTLILAAKGDRHRGCKGTDGHWHFMDEHEMPERLAKVGERVIWLSFLAMI